MSSLEDPVVFRNRPNVRCVFTSHMAGWSVPSAMHYVIQLDVLHRPSSSSIPNPIEKLGRAIGTQHTQANIISMLCVPVYKVSHVTCQFSKTRYQFPVRCWYVVRCSLCCERAHTRFNHLFSSDNSNRHTTTAKPNSIRQSAAIFLVF